MSDKTIGMVVSEIAIATGVQRDVILRRLKARSRVTPKSVRELAGDVSNLVFDGESLEASIAKVCGDVEEET